MADIVVSEIVPVGRSGIGIPWVFSVASSFESAPKVMGDCHQGEGIDSVPFAKSFRQRFVVLSGVDRGESGNGLVPVFGELWVLDHGEAVRLGLSLRSPMLAPIVRELAIVFYNLGFRTTMASRLMVFLP